MAQRILLALLAAACCAGAPMAARGEEVPSAPYETLRIGDPVGPAITVGRKLLVLPEGRWQLAVRFERPVSSDGSDNLGRMVRLFLQEVVAGRLSRTLEIATNLSSSRVNWHDLPCKTKGDSYWVQDRAYGINSQFCTRVGYTHGVAELATGADYQAWARALVAQGIAYPREMPFVQVTRYTGSDFLRMRVSFDPGASGIGDSARPQRHLNDWHPDNIRAGSAHEKFYQSLVDWAPGYAANVARVFEQDGRLRPGDYGRPSRPQVP